MHIFHNGGNPTNTGDNNFTIAEIQSAIDRLNEVYAGRRPNLNNVNDEFINSGIVATHTSNINRVDYSVAPASTQLINPDPNCFGRIKNSPVNLPSGGSQLADNFVSPYVTPCTFLNIYTGPYGVNHPSIAADTTCSSRNGLSYAYKIYQSDGGVRIDDNMFVPRGSITIPTSGFNLGVTLAHEVGHYLCLSHIWGPTNITSVIQDSLSSNPEYFCNIDDGFEDTPRVAQVGA
ncbi:MAG: hypothetical protein ACI94Y_002873 [Maribacter sp.]|jgi:hypothetical protein